MEGNVCSLICLGKETVSKSIYSDTEFSTADTNTEHQGFKTYGYFNATKPHLEKNLEKLSRTGKWLESTSCSLLVSMYSLEFEKKKILQQNSRNIGVSEKSHFKTNGGWAGAFGERWCSPLPPFELRHMLDTTE